MSEGKGNNKSCLYGCGSLIIIAVLVIAGGYFYVRDRFEYVGEVEDSTAEIKDKYGEIYDYTPPLEAEIEESRLLLFIEIKDSLKEISQVTGEKLLNFSQNMKNANKEDESFSDVISAVSSSVSFFPKVINYFKKRNNLLLEKQMGFGEYYYLSVATYYAYLKKSPGDGPKFQLKDGKKIKINDSEIPTEEEIVESRKTNISIGVNRNFRKIFKNKIVALTNNNMEQQAEVYRNKVNLLMENPVLLPWSDGFDEKTITLLEKYRDKLESTYNPTINPVEITNID